MINLLFELINTINRYNDFFVVASLVPRLIAFIGFAFLIIPKQVREAKVRDDISTIRKSLLGISLIVESIYIYSIYLTACRYYGCLYNVQQGFGIFLYSIGFFLVFVMVYLIYKKRGDY